MDFFERISQWWTGIPVCLRKSALFIFLTVNFVFATMTFHWLIGNHEPDPFRLGIPLQGLLFCSGRFFSGVPLSITAGNYLPPIWNPAGFLCMVLWFIKFSLMLRLPQRTMLWTFCGIFALTLPFFTSILYYTNSFFPFALQFLLVQTAVDLIRKKPSFTRTAAGAGIFCFVCGIYQTILATAGITILALFLNDLAENKTPLREMIRKFGMLALAAAGGAGLYGLLYKAAKAAGVLDSSLYILQVNPIAPLAIPGRILYTTANGFRDFFLRSDYLPPSYRMLLVLLVAGGFLAVCARILQSSADKKETTQQGSLRLGIRLPLAAFALAGCFFLMEFSSFLVPDMVHAQRLVFFSVLPFTLFSLIFILRSPSAVWRNAGIAAAAAALWWGLIVDVHFQKTMLFGHRAERACCERILASLEQSGKIAPATDYILVTVGIPPNRRMKDFTFRTPLPGAWEDAIARTFTGTEIVRRHTDLEHVRGFAAEWDAAAVFRFIDGDRWKSGGTLPGIIEEGKFKDTELDTPEFRKFLETAEPYPAPHEKWLFTAGNTIVLVLNSAELEKTRRLLADSASPED